MKKFFIVLLMAGFVSALTGCETMKGLGKDIQKAGEAIEDTAND